MANTYSKGAYGAGLYSTAESLDSTAISSWSFAIDGHQFVFINLGIEGTIVLDASTGKWSQWATKGCVGLPFSSGQTFNDFCLMGSSTDNSIYTFDPDSLDDDDEAFETTVTAGLPAKTREALECFAVYLSGNPSGEPGRSTSLVYSDDNGDTWQDAGADSPVEQGDEISWRSLGLIRYPGRLFRITDDGALLGIDKLTMVTDGS